MEVKSSLFGSSARGVSSRESPSIPQCPSPRDNRSSSPVVPPQRLSRGHRRSRELKTTQRSGIRLLNN